MPVQSACNLFIATELIHLHAVKTRVGAFLSFLRRTEFQAILCDIFRNFVLQMTNPASRLLKWYSLEGRVLPWRETRDPYKIWLSEVILQQTRIDQGIPYYHRLVERFPTVKDLADADTDTLMKYWEGLGYYSRARNLHHTAKVIATEHDGIFPDSYQELMLLKGIGPYTARAIGSIAFNNVTGVLDGNVFRVVSRYLGDFSPIDLPGTRTCFQDRLDRWIEAATLAHEDATLPGKFNQAMMDLGAMVCTPRSPSCTTCPLAVDCIGHSHGYAEELPIKSKKLERKTIWHHFFLVGVDAGQVWIQRRPPSGLWSHLWELPNEAVSQEAWNNANLPSYQLMGAFKHVFTHLDMMIKVYSGMELPSSLVTEHEEAERRPRPVPLDSIGNFAFSRAVLKIFQRYLTPSA